MLRLIHKKKYYNYFQQFLPFQFKNFLNYVIYKLTHQVHSDLKSRKDTILLQLLPKIFPYPFTYFYTNNNSLSHCELQN